MASALEGLRVLDLTSGPAGGLATMILADFGAEVLLIERPQPDPLAALPAARMWRRGKRTLTLDLATDRGLETLHGLCAGADVLICNWRPGALARKGLDFDRLHARHPHLVFCHLTGFGSRGPRADYPGYEHLVAAASGRMQLFSGLADRPGPTFSALQVGVHACAQAAAAGILAALYARAADGVGRLVETSLLQGLLAYEQFALLGRQFPGRVGELAAMLEPPAEPPLPSLYYHPAQAGDGRWVQFGNLLPHLFENFLIAAELIDVLADPDFDAAQIRFSSEEKQEAFRERMLRRIQSRPAADWIADFAANGSVAATVYQTTRQALGDPDLIANGHVLARADGSVQLGPVARLTRTPAQPGGDATPDDVLAERWRSNPRPAPHATKRAGAPLDGVRVIELATIIAAPLGASFLADMGAEVIKVEPVGGDPYRGLLAGMGAARVNGGKRSLSVDLKTEAGRAIVLGLVEKADVLIHNYRPGVPERLGIGYDQVAALNPRLVYLQCNGYGPDGPSAQRPSTHPIPGAALGGALFQLGERVPESLQDIDGLRLWTRRLMRANELNPDPNTSVVVATAVMLALVARQRTGQGQRVLVDMFGANAWANQDDFLDYPGKPPRALPDPALLGLSATYRLYRCAGDQWVFLALTNERERRRFLAALERAGMTPAADLLTSDDTETACALEALFATKDADTWEELLGSAGCVRADRFMPGDFWLEDPHARVMEATAEVQHAWGRCHRHGALVRFDGRSPALGPAPLAGQHNDEVLAACGYSAADVARLVSEGVLWREEPD